jgi:hypothetical protein
VAGDQPDVRALEPFVGTWEVQAEFPYADMGTVSGRTTFGWLLGDRFLLQRAEVDHPDAPDSHTVIAPDPDQAGGYRQHYFDSRGVVRLYGMTFDGREWTLLRRSPDFSPLDFAQRFTASFGDDGDTITGRWEIAPDGGDFQPDFTLTYRRIG